jgi:hypothetical protein
VVTRVQAPSGEARSGPRKTMEKVSRVAWPSQSTTPACRRPRVSRRRGFRLDWRRVGDGFCRTYGVGVAPDGGGVGVARPEGRMERRSLGEVAETEGGGGVYLVELSTLDVERREGGGGVGGRRD